MLRGYHSQMEVIIAHEGTLERFAGDGMMVFFVIRCGAGSAVRAVRMVVEMRERLADPTTWKKRGFAGFRRWHCAGLRNHRCDRLRVGGTTVLSGQ